MSYECTVVCDRDRCAVTSPAEFIPGQRKLHTPEGWRYLGRGIHVCPACAAGVDAWLHRQPQPPVGSLTISARGAGGMTREQADHIAHQVFTAVRRHSQEHPDTTADDTGRVCSRCHAEVAYLSSHDECDGCVAEIEAELAEGAEVSS